MKRTKQHRIDASAKAILMKNAPKNWSLAEPSEDYGNDYFVKVFDKDTDEATKISFIIQLKGTEDYKKDEKHVKFSISTDYLKYYYYKVDMPVFLVVVDTINEEYCWLFIQKYINEELNVKKPNWKSQQTITLYIPIENTFSNPQIIEQTAAEGSQYCNFLVNGTPTQEFIWKVKNITDNPLEKSKDLKEQYSKIFEAETKVAFEFIHNQNDSDNAKKHFQSVYDKTKDDEDNVMAHLNSIWRTAAFEHIFWLNQAGKATQEYGVRFEEDFGITEAADSNIFMDAHAHIRTDIDALLSGEVVESVEKPLEEDADLFMDAHAGVETKLDDVLSGAMTEAKDLKESYRRTVSRGASLVDNELFIDFD